MPMFRPGVGDVFVMFMELVFIHALMELSIFVLFRFAHESTSARIYTNIPVKRPSRGRCLIEGGPRWGAATRAVGRDAEIAK